MAAFILPPVGVPLAPRPAAPPAPSAAAAAGAAAAALLQRQLAQDGGVAGQEKPEGGWSEHQTGDGRKFYFHEEGQSSTWEKPEVLMTAEEKANDTKWREYKIWDGRVFYHNRETKVSCWSMPPELRQARGQSSGVDDEPLQQTSAEKRQAFWEMLSEKGVDEDWTWRAVSEAVAVEAQAEALEETAQKQCFAELLSLSLRRRQIQAREEERNAAGALERLIEERFSSAKDLGTTYEEASQLLGGEEAWQRITSEVRRDEVFQAVMEKLEEQHRKTRADERAERVVRLQRLLASDPELRRVRLRWKDARAILAKRDELQEEEPSLEALRVWASLRDLKHVSEHEAEVRGKVQPDQSSYRADRKRRDDFVAGLRELAQQGTLLPQTSWADLEASAEAEQRKEALHDGPGATAMELFDEFMVDLKQRGPESFARSQEPGPEAGAAEPAPKRQRTSGWAPVEESQEVAAAASAPDAAGTSALDDLIAGPSLVGVSEGADAQDSSLSAAKAQEASRKTESGAGPGQLQEKETGVRVGVEPAELAGISAEPEEVPVPVPVPAPAPTPEPSQPSLEAAPTAAAAPTREVSEPTETPASAAEPPPASTAVAAAPSTGAAAQAVPPASEPPPRLSSAELLARRVDELRAMCKERGLPVSGRKQELVDRLVAA